MARTDAETLQARLDRAINALESRSREVLDTLKEEGKRAEATAQEHVWISLLTALGIGLLFGLVLGLTRR